MNRTKIRLMSYNIQHGNDYKNKTGINLNQIAEVIRSLDPDIVGLNEVRGRGEREDYTAQAEFLGASLGYHAYFGRSIYVDGVNPYGNAVLSKRPIVSASVNRIPDPIPRDNHVESRTVLRAEIELSNGRFAVYASHFGLSRAELEHAASTALTLTRDESLPFALMGDFNMTPSDPLLSPLYDILNSTSPFTDEKLSFPSDNPTEKIDYIFTSKNVHIIFADIPAVEASDHRPIIADVEI